MAAEVGVKMITDTTVTMAGRETEVGERLLTQARVV